MTRAPWWMKFQALVCALQLGVASPVKSPSARRTRFAVFEFGRGGTGGIPGEPDGWWDFPRGVHLVATPVTSAEKELVRVNDFLNCFGVLEKGFRPKGGASIPLATPNIPPPSAYRPAITGRRYGGS